MLGYETLQTNKTCVRHRKDDKSSAEGIYLCRFFSDFRLGNQWNGGDTTECPPCGCQRGWGVVQPPKLNLKWNTWTLCVRHYGENEKMKPKKNDFTLTAQDQKWMTNTMSTNAKTSLYAALGAILSVYAVYVEHKTAHKSPDEEFSALCDIESIGASCRWVVLYILYWKESFANNCI